MHTLIHAILLFVFGFCLAFSFLALTRPPQPPVTTTRSQSTFCEPSSSSSWTTSNDPHHHHHATTTTATTQSSFVVNKMPRFWERYEPPVTAAVAAATRRFNAAEFQTPAHNMTRTTTSNKTKNDAVFFLHQPHRFVELFRNCEADKDCYIAYHHVPKTGGTTMESALSAIFGQADESSCCGEWALHNFYQNTSHYCLHNKFTAWQMEYPLYFEMLDTCFQKQYNPDGKRRVLVLITFREPISTTLSFIHQRCNKNWERRNEFVQEACTVCQYEQHRKIWDRFADLITQQLQGAWKVWHAIQDDERFAAGNVSALPTHRLQVALLEPNDIDDFLKAWKPQMNFSKVNPELLNRCYFRMTKEYIDKLEPAAEWYRRFVSGVAA